MSTVKWALKGAKIGIEILEKADVDLWLENEGQDLFVETLKNLSVKWFVGDNRAKNKIFSEVSDKIKKSDTFRASLEKELAKLPLLIWRSALFVKKKHPDIFIEEFEKGKNEETRWLAVVPKLYVQEAYFMLLMEKLSKAGEMEKFPGLPKHFLRNKTISSEKAFFTFIKKKTYYIIDTNKIILYVDDDYEWLPNYAPGHYYFAQSISEDEDLHRRRYRRAFQSLFEKRVKEKRAELGKLTKDERRKIAAKVEDVVNVFHGLIS